MMLHGWCEKCHKIKRVRVSNASLARAGRGIIVGICASCQEATDGATRN